MELRSKFGHSTVLAIIFVSFFVSASTGDVDSTKKVTEVLTENGTAISAEMYQNIDEQSSQKPASMPTVATANSVNQTMSSAKNESSAQSVLNQGKDSKDDASKQDTSSANKTIAASGEKSTESVPPVVPLASNSTEASTLSTHVSKTEEMPSAEVTTVPEVNTPSSTNPVDPSSESTKTPKPAETTLPSGNSTNTTNQSSNTTSKDETTPLPTTIGETIGNSSQAEAVSASKSGDDHESSSAGIFALVMAISFTIVVIIVYFGLVAWRRYLEYRYGTRELLVNDLEFDTNDLHHFEL